ncbi:TetR/AcrR family transcriptional regulator [bacterium]|nr:TetR/AcrR family transcriptional regulator [bacterium]
MARARKVLEEGGGDSRQRLLDTASRLFRVQGYHATGLNQIVDESQAPKGSLYHYFPQGKEQLATEALVNAGQSLRAKLSGISGLTPAEAIDRLVEISIGELESSNYRDGCPIATVALETNSSSEAIRGVCQHIFGGALKLLTDWLVGKGLCEERARVLSLTVFSAYEGALMLSKVQHSPQPLREVASQLKVFVKDIV